MFETAHKDETKDHRVLIVGGGVAGLDLATSLGSRRGVSVSLVDAAVAHVWKPMLHSIAAGTQDAALVGVPYVTQARRHGFAYIPGRATAVDADARRVKVAPFVRHDHPLLPERDVPYDTLVLATGSVADPFGVPGVADHTHHIDDLAQASNFQEQLAPRLAAAVPAGRSLTIVIVGGGATGVQLAAEMLEVADTFDRLGLDGARKALRIVLVDRGERLLPAFPERVSAAARARLEALGILVRLNVVVAEATTDGLILEGGERLAADLAVWAAGVKASPLTDAISGLERHGSGRIAVDRQCRTSRPDIFALGDCAHFVSAGEEKPLPPTAQVAYQQAVYLGRRLPDLIAGQAVPGFRYRDYGALVALGHYDAYGALGRFGVFGKGFIKGRVAQAGHALLYRRHQLRLHGLREMLLLWIAERARGAIGRTGKLS